MDKKHFSEVVEQTREMIARFQEIEQKPWGIEGSMIELSKQVGDLSKLVMVQEKYYIKSREAHPDYVATKEKIADEIFDIWFCLIRVADHYKIDIEQTLDSITKKELDDFKEGRII